MPTTKPTKPRSVADMEPRYCKDCRWFNPPTLEKPYVTLALCMHRNAMLGVEWLVHGGEPSEKDARSCIFMRASDVCDRAGKLWEPKQT